MEANLSSGKKAKKFVLGVADSKLGGAIQEAMGLKCEAGGAVAEVIRGVRLYFTKLVKGLCTICNSYRAFSVRCGSNFYYFVCIPIIVHFKLCSCCLQWPCYCFVLRQLLQSITFVTCLAIVGLPAPAAAKAQLGLGHSYSRAKVKFNVHRADNMIIQSISLLDQVDKDINTFSMRIRWV